VHCPCSLCRYSTLRLVTISVQVLDEIYRILKFVRVTPSPPRAHELLQELRDISSMAMEHFDEKIVPNLRERMPETSKLRQILSAGSSDAGSWNWSSTSATFRFKGVHCFCYVHSLAATPQQNAWPPSAMEKVLLKMVEWYCVTTDI